jgi:hypothetical protein
MLIDVMDDENVWVIQRARGLGFVFKSRQAIARVCQRGRQNFDRDFTIHPGIVRAINLAHSARANF